MSYAQKVKRTRAKFEAALANGASSETVHGLRSKLSKRAAKLERDNPGAPEAKAAAAALSAVIGFVASNEEDSMKSMGTGALAGIKNSGVVSEAKRRKTNGGSTDNQPPGDQLQRVTGDTTILLFYGYVTPLWTKTELENAVKWAYENLSSEGCTGRLRVAREGVNGTLTGPRSGIRAFTAALAARYPEHFGGTYNQFKYVDNLPESQMLSGLKVWPVAELVTYGFEEHKKKRRKQPGACSASNASNASRREERKNGEAPKGGTHLSPEMYHKALKDPSAVVIDVRNFNESLIGKFAPAGGATVLDPEMRRSTEFPQWVDKNIDKLRGKKVLMYCTGGIRCERASAYLTSECGLEDVNQLEGGIHRYLETFSGDGGHWVGKNYTFDKRFSHGAARSETISECVICKAPWERYQAHLKCSRCKMEVLVCKTCTRNKKTKPIQKSALFCPLCDPDMKSRAEKNTTRASLAKNGDKATGGELDNK